MMAFKDGLYNQQVYLPPMTFKSIDFQLRYTWHARNEADKDGVTPPDYINFANTEIVELEVVNGKPFKVLVREYYDHKRDIVLAILLKDLTVKTVWVNSRNDNHSTLDKSRYVRRPRKEQ